MARQKYRNVVRNSRGDAVAGAAVEVRNAAGEWATLYEAETGNTTLTNPFYASDGDVEGAGTFEFWVDEADYGDFTITVGAGSSADTFPVRIAVNAPSTQATRSAFVSAIDAGVYDRVGDGFCVSVGRLTWSKQAGTEYIDDMPGWMPVAPAYPDHMKENTTPGTTDMGQKINEVKADFGTVHFLDVPYASSVGITLMDGDGLVGETTSNTDVLNQNGAAIVFTGSEGLVADNVERLNMRNIAVIADSGSTVAKTFDGTNVYGSYFQNVRFANNASGHAFYNEIQAGEGAGVAWNNHFIGCWFSAETGYSCYNEGTDSFYVSPYFTGGAGAKIAASGTSITGAHAERGDEGFCLFDPEDRAQVRATVSGLYIDLCDKGLVFEAGRSAGDTRMDIVVTGYTARSNTTADIVIRNTDSNTISGGHVLGYVTDGVAADNITEEPGTGTIGEYTVQKLSPGTVQHIGSTEKDLVIGDLITGQRFLTSTLVYDRTGAASANVVVGTDGTIKRSTSARKYKQDIAPVSLQEARNFFDNAAPVRYRSRSEGDADDAVWYGYIADDVADIDPRLVQFSPDGEPEGFNYDRVAALLHVVVRDMCERLEALEAGN